MILWFGNKKKKDELKTAGAAMVAPELSADDLATQAAAEADSAGSPDQAHQLEETTSEGDVEAADQKPFPTIETQSASEEPQAGADPDKATGAVSAPDPQDAQPVPEAISQPPATDTFDAAQMAEDGLYPSPEPVADPSPGPTLSETQQAGFFAKLTSGLSKTSSKIGDSVTGLFTKRKLDDAALEDLEDLLLTSDMGARVASRISASLARSRYDKDISESELKSVLADEIESILAPRERIVDFSDGPRPRVVLFVGVNGSGKTTTIGKIASKLKTQGAKALLVAGDTFRAAAIEQLTVWGERAGIPVLAKSPGADAAGLVYEAVEKARREDLDLVLVDTAGRLQNKAELMSELAKIIRVLRKLDPDAPHDVILVLDATVGQNALSQVEAFRHTAEVSGLVMTKLDGTAKGGVLVAIAEAHDLPIHFVGVGEKAEDLQPFSARAFARALVGLSDFSKRPV